MKTSEEIITRLEADWIFCTSLMRLPNNPYNEKQNEKIVELLNNITDLVSIIEEGE